MPNGDTIDVTVPQAGTETEASISEIACVAGDQVQQGQTLLVLEMDKALVEIDAPTAGEIVEVAVSEGDDVGVGDVLLRIRPGS